jgi:hypothetical protein
VTIKPNAEVGSEAVVAVIDEAVLRILYGVELLSTLRSA